MKEVKAWISNKGNVYTNRVLCAREDKLVVCKLCNSTGLEKYEHVIPYPSGLPDSGWVDDTIEIRERTCTRCKGLGYVECNIEDDTEYQEFLRLREKYKDIK